MANTTAVALFEQGMPAHIAEAFAGRENIKEKIDVPQLSMRGKVWRVVIKGIENIILDKTQEPVTSVQGVLIGVQEGRSRSFFLQPFEDGKFQPPTCWSNDGITPEKEVADKQSPKCATCPQAAKGAKVTPSGKAVAACGQFKKVVWIPYPQVDVIEPLLVKFPQTSLWDKEGTENEAKGQYALDQYLDMLKRNNVNHTSAVVTRFSFDPRLAYPKILCQVKAWVAPELTARVLELVDDPRVKDLLAASAYAVAERHPETPAPDAPAETAQVAPATTAAAPAQAVKAAAPAQAAKPPPPAAKKAPPAPAPAAAAAPAAATGNGEDDSMSFGKAGAQPAAAAAPAVATAGAVGTTAALGDLVNAWDD
jgi:hypothetical protein